MIEQQRQLIEMQQRVGVIGAADPPGTWLGFVPTTALQPFSADGFVFLAGLPRATQTPRRFRCWAYVAGTNNAFNFWIIDAQDAATNSLAAVSTGGGVPIAADTWTLIETTSFSADPMTAASEAVVQIYITALGAPGSLSLIPMLYIL